MRSGVFSKSTARPPPCRSRFRDDARSSVAMLQGEPGEQVPWIPGAPALAGQEVREGREPGVVDPDVGDLPGGHDHEDRRSARGTELDHHEEVAVHGGEIGVLPGERGSGVGGLGLEREGRALVGRFEIPDEVGVDLRTELQEVGLAE
jgi:hypothetical protein